MLSILFTSKWYFRKWQTSSDHNLDIQQELGIAISTFHCYSDQLWLHNKIVELKGILAPSLIEIAFLDQNYSPFSPLLHTNKRKPINDRKHVFTTMLIE